MKHPLCWGFAAETLLLILMCAFRITAEAGGSEMNFARVGLVNFAMRTPSDGDEEEGPLRC